MIQGTISVMIPAYNEERYIAKALRSLLDQTYQDIEIYVVDDGSKDNTISIVESFVKQDPRVHLLRQNHGGPARARNLALSHAKGLIIVSVDADMVFDKYYIEKLTQPIREGKEIGTFHLCEYVANKENVWARCWGVRRADPKKHAKRKKAVIRAIKTSVLRELGGFSPKRGYFDDTAFNSGGMIPDLLGVEEAIVYHHNPETLREIFQQTQWIGGSLVLYPLIAYELLRKFWGVVALGSFGLGIGFGAVLFTEISFLSGIGMLAAAMLATVALGIEVLTIKRTVKEKYISHLVALPVFYTVRLSGLLYGVTKQLVCQGISLIRGKDVGYTY